MKPSTLYSWKECQVKITLSYETKSLAYHCIGERDWEKREGAASNGASLALIKPFFIHPFFSSIQFFHPSNFFIHLTCALCILPPPEEATERVKGRERRPHREASLEVIKYLVHLPCICSVNKPSICLVSSSDPSRPLHIHQHHQIWLQGEKRAEKKVLWPAKSDLASSPPE